MSDAHLNATSSRKADGNRATTVPDQTSFLQLVSWELRRGARYRRTFTLMRVGVDGPGSAANRTGGFDSAVAEVIRESLRDADVVAPIGAGEFAVLLPETGLALVSPVFQRVMDSLLRAAAAQGWPGSFSLGAVTWREAEVSPEYLFQRAGELLDQARVQSARLVAHEVLL
jgi:diguanylate cyclase (GGDEF)-like protein